MKKSVLVDVKVECEAPTWIWGRTLEERARNLERWADEFHEFIRDHRSQDPVALSVERVFQDQCEFCGSEWEKEPACCGKAMDEWEAQQQEQPA